MPRSWWWSTTIRWLRWWIPKPRPTDEVLLFPEVGTNVVMRLESSKRADFGGCEVVVSLRVENQRMTAAPIEPRSGAALLDRRRTARPLLGLPGRASRPRGAALHLRAAVRADPGHRAGRRRWLRRQVPMPGGRAAAGLDRPPAGPPRPLDGDPVREHGGHAPRAGTAPAPQHRRHPRRPGHRLPAGRRAGRRRLPGDGRIPPLDDAADAHRRLRPGQRGLLLGLGGDHRHRP